MRLDTYSFRNHLIEQLEHPATNATILHDLGDVILVRLATGQQIDVHLIERPIQTQEIYRIHAENHQRNVFTLYLMWCDLLLPDHQEQFQPESWMLTLHTINRQRLYSYKVYGAECFIYPVHLERATRRLYRTFYGAPIKIPHIGCAVNRMQTHNAAKEWLIVDFDDRRYRYQEAQREEQARLAARIDASLIPCFDLLGMELTDDRNAIRRTYRQLARQYHPDVNQTPEATVRMQRINEAYRLIMTWFDRVST